MALSTYFQGFVRGVLLALTRTLLNVANVGLIWLDVLSAPTPRSAWLALQGTTSVAIFVQVVILSRDAPPAHHQQIVLSAYRVFIFPAHLVAIAMIAYPDASSAQIPPLAHYVVDSIHSLEVIALVVRILLVIACTAMKTDASNAKVDSSCKMVLALSAIPLVEPVWM